MPVDLSAAHPVRTGWAGSTVIYPSLIKGGKAGVSIACSNWLKFSIPSLAENGFVAARLLVWVSNAPVANGDWSNIIHVAAEVSPDASWDAGSSLATLEGLALYPPTYPILGVDANTAASGDYAFFDVTAGLNQIIRAAGFEATAATIRLGFTGVFNDDTLDTRDYPRLAFPSDFNASSTNKMDEVKFAGMSAGSFKPFLELFYGNDIQTRPGGSGGEHGWHY